MLDRALAKIWSGYQHAGSGGYTICVQSNGTYARRPDIFLQKYYFNEAMEL